MARNRQTAETKGQASKKKNTKDITPKDGVKKAKRVPRGSKRDWSQYSHNLPDQTELSKNGRQAGRNLIVWTRPRMAEKLLLHIEYEALLHNRPIPWDAVAHRFNPGSSGDAITQRLMRMRKELIAEGHLVPPIPQKPGGPVEDVAVRGLMRANPDRVDDAYTTRRVLWTEPMDDLKKPLGNAVYALQDQSENKADNYEDEFEQNKNASYLDRSDSNNDLESGPGVDESTKGKDPARLARPSRSTAKKISYAEDQDDGFDTVLAIESDAEDDNEGFEQLGATYGSQSSSRASHLRRNNRTRNRGSGACGHPINSGFPPAYSHTSGFNHPSGAMTPGPRSQGANHMSPYGMTPNGVHWLHSPMGLPMMPIGMGMDMMGGFNTTPSRSSAFTTHATSPAAFDIEDASPRSAAFFQAHLNEYNSPTPRGHADFSPMMPIPMGMIPTNASMMPGSTMMSRNTMMSGNVTMPDNGTTSDNPMTMFGGANLATMDEGEADTPQTPLDVKLPSMFSDADTMAKRLKKTNERK